MKTSLSNFFSLESALSITAFRLYVFWSRTYMYCTVYNSIEKYVQLYMQITDGQHEIFDCASLTMEQ